jgi:hypothetical protein
MILEYIVLFTLSRYQPKRHWKSVRTVGCCGCGDRYGITVHKVRMRYYTKPIATKLDSNDGLSPLNS